MSLFNDRESGHMLCKAENIFFLKRLRTEGIRADMIYIDPPYNTKSDRFLYLDKRPDWIEFMEIRLSLARDLLTDNGVIFVSIDDNELYNLKPLMDNIFGQKNFVANVIWRKTGQQQNNGVNIAVVTEYILCYGKNLFDESGRKKNLFNKDNIENRKGIKAYRYIDDSTGRRYRLNPIQDRSYGNHSYSLVHPVSGKVVKSDNWRLSPEKFKDLEKQGLIHWTGGLPNTKKFLDHEQGVLPVNLIDDCFNESGSNELAGLVKDCRFVNPKPVSLIKRLVRMVNKRDGTVLDFFAGSGTTGQAVMELNQESGFEMRTILCTNNENNIFDRVTLPRIKAVAERTKEKVYICSLP